MLGQVAQIAVEERFRSFYPHEAVEIDAATEQEMDETRPLQVLFTERAFTFGANQAERSPLRERLDRRLAPPFQLIKAKATRHRGPRLHEARPRRRARQGPVTRPSVSRGGATSRVLGFYPASCPSGAGVSWRRSAPQPPC